MGLTLGDAGAFLRESKANGSARTPVIHPWAVTVRAHQRPQILRVPVGITLCLLATVRGVPTVPRSRVGAGEHDMRLLGGPGVPLDHLAPASFQA